MARGTVNQSHLEKQPNDHVIRQSCTRGVGLESEETCVPSSNSDRVFSEESEQDETEFIKQNLSILTWIAFP